jgi:Transposase and inactivated derivatives
MEEYHVELTIQRALEKFPGYNPRIISDNGSQFISGDFRKFLREIGLCHVRTSVRYPQSNGKIERFHRTLKDECLSKQSLIDLNDARQQIDRYIEKYNTKRLHSALNYLTPEDYLLGRVESRLNERNLKLNQAVKNRKNYAKLHLN